MNIINNRRVPHHDVDRQRPGQYGGQYAVFNVGGAHAVADGRGDGLVTGSNRYPRSSIVFGQDVIETTGRRPSAGGGNGDSTTGTSATTAVIRNHRVRY